MFLSTETGNRRYLVAAPLLVSFSFFLSFFCHFMLVLGCYPPGRA